jgi:large repetitive protein
MTIRVVEAPIAQIDAPERVAVGDVASFDASGSSGASGRILAWRWDFGDGGTAEGAQAKHVFKTAGSHVVTLIIDTDAEPAAARPPGSARSRSTRRPCPMPAKMSW